MKRISEFIFYLKTLSGIFRNICGLRAGARRKVVSEEWRLYILDSQWIRPLVAMLLTLFYLILTENQIKMRKLKLKIHIYSLPNHTVNKSGIEMTTGIKCEQLTAPR